MTSKRIGNESKVLVSVVYCVEKHVAAASIDPDAQSSHKNVVVSNSSGVNYPCMISPECAWDEGEVGEVEQKRRRTNEPSVVWWYTTTSFGWMGARA